jgi:hypothetical protein
MAILLRLLNRGVKTAAAAKARYGSHLVECPDVHTLLTLEGADRQPLEALQQWEQADQHIQQRQHNAHSQDIIRCKIPCFLDSSPVAFLAGSSTHVWPSSHHPVRKTLSSEYATSCIFCWLLHTCLTFYGPSSCMHPGVPHIQAGATHTRLTIDCHVGIYCITCSPWSHTHLLIQLCAQRVGPTASHLGRPPSCLCCCCSPLALAHWVER